MKKRVKGSQPRYDRDYRQRGISVCARWKKFEAFLKDMGECPDGLTLERIHNSRGYTPGNCKWADRTAQARNRRSTVLNEKLVRYIRKSGAKGAAIARELGISAWVVYNVRQNKSWKNI